jgi:hypothetical protein
MISHNPVALPISMSVSGGNDPVFVVPGIDTSDPPASHMLCLDRTTSIPCDTFMVYADAGWISFTVGIPRSPA